MNQITQEMRAIYREARAGQFEGGWAACGTAMRCLPLAISKRVWTRLSSTSIYATRVVRRQKVTSTMATIAREPSNEPRSAGARAASGSNLTLGTLVWQPR